MRRRGIGPILCVMLRVIVRSFIIAFSLVFVCLVAEVFSMVWSSEVEKQES